MADKLTDTQILESAIRDIIIHIGDNPDNEHCRDTPKRVVKSWAELYGGYHKDPVAALGTTFSADNYDQMVVLKDIELYSICSHHMIPFYGKAHIAYIPKHKVVGLSKLARVTEIFARRLQVQERLTAQIADTIQEVLDPQGVGVMIEARHMCMCARGVGKQNSSMVTSALRGVFTRADVKSEFIELVRGK